MASDRTKVEVVLECHLHSRSEGTTEVKFLSLTSLPGTVLELKQLAQAEFSVPACAQTVAFQTEVLTDDTQLASRRLRSGDAVDITFLSRGDCRSVEEVKTWMKSIMRIFNDDSYTMDQRNRQVEAAVYGGIQNNLDTTLGNNLFKLLTSQSRSMVNRAYFEAVGGLELLLHLYQRLLSHPWSNLGIRQKYLEIICMQAFSNFGGETVRLRRRLVGLGILDLCFLSLLRVPIPFNKPVSDLSSNPANKEHNDHLLKEELDMALHLLCFMAELPECQLEIATRSDVITQTVAMALSPSYPCSIKTLASEVFLCLAHTSSTHWFLATEPVISGMLQAMASAAKNPETTPTYLAGLRCFTLVWMSIILLQSPLAFPQKYLHQIAKCVTKFLAETTIEDIRNYEADRGTIWGTLLPYVKLFYLPNPPKPPKRRGWRRGKSDPLPTGLRDNCQRVILLFLHSKISTHMYHVLLEQEGLLDFVICLPWNITASCRPSALAMVSDLCTSLPSVGPPQLMSMAKASLAKEWLGLEPVLNLSVGTIASRFFTTEQS